ncbi:MAG: hypothetical protein OEM85_09470 [Gammaproteobacteria bacterium]|nr:hypothetical protein [Gammaproteobacteria bacterium]
MIKCNGFNRPVVPNSSNDRVSHVNFSAEETAEWNGIVARATVLDVCMNSAVLIVPAARDVVPWPTTHDILHAQVTHYVFEQQPQPCGASPLTVLLADKQQRLFHVPQPETAFEDFLRRYDSERLRSATYGQPVPAPLVGFLFRQSLQIR